MTDDTTFEELQHAQQALEAALLMVCLGSMGLYEVPEEVESSIVLAALARVLVGAARDAGLSHEACKDVLDTALKYQAQEEKAEEVASFVGTKNAKNN